MTERIVQFGLGGSLVGASVLLMLSGCVAPANDAIGLGPAAPLPALGQREETPDPSAGAPLLSGDRSNWPAVKVRVPLTRVASYPGYWAARPLDPDDDGDLGDVYPTATSALDGPSGDDRIGDAALGVAAGVIDIPWSPIRAAFDQRWPKRLEDQPSTPYQRTPGYGVHADAPAPAPDANDGDT